MSLEEQSNAGSLSLSARVIPLPSQASPQARQALASPRVTSFDWPDPGDAAAWKSLAEAADKMIGGLFAQLPPFDGSVTAHGLGDGVTLYELRPHHIAPRNASRALLYLHGGAFVMGGGELAATVATPMASAMGCVVYSLDYRMPPDHPYPAALDDAVAAYRWVIERHAPTHVGVAGVSAGAGLAAAAILKARDVGLPLPGAAVLLTPEADLTESGDTFETLRDIDVVLRQRLTPAVAVYANGHDLRSPYLSPVFGDFSKGYPPTFLQSGTRDLFLSNTVLLHRALRRGGQAAELHVFEGMPHGGFVGAPEDQECLQEQLRFLDEHLAFTGASAQHP